MKKKALFPGSFDPFTIGHESIVRRSMDLFDEMIIGIGINKQKSGFISTENRIKIIEKVFIDDPKVSVMTYSGLTIDFCKSNNCQFILRGLRTAADFEFERTVGQINKHLQDNIETIFMLTLPGHSFISSSIVREVIQNNGCLRGLLPQGISQSDLGL
jgi:pantetheine-phosphate adenylyltransferase